MRAVVLREFGPPDRLAIEDVPDPAPGPGQVVVEAELANITFVETQIRAGRAPNPAMLPSLPAVLGNGVGGRVITAGAGVDAALVGTRVVTSTGGSGGYAEQAAVDAGLLIAIPSELGTSDAVALLADGRTAMALMRGAAVQTGETVLVEAAAGAVGSVLVQLARTAGARVVALAGGEPKLELARQLGADFALDYREPDWVQRARAAVGSVDVVFDGVGGDTASSAVELLRPNGRLCAFGMASGSFVRVPEGANVEVIRGLSITPGEGLELTRRALDEARSGRLRPLIGQTFPLEQAWRAHAAIGNREAMGKTLLTI